jgi:hypothetical protein
MISREEAIQVERVTLRRVTRTFGFAKVSLPGVHLNGLRVEEREDGRLTIGYPIHEDRRGIPRYVYVLRLEVATLSSARLGSSGKSRRRAGCSNER